MADDYMKERAADVRDLSTRVCDILLQQHSDPLAGCTHPVIIAAEDLLPSQTVRLDKQKVVGFITRGGTFNSHAAILARSLGIAAVAALGSGFALGRVITVSFMGILVEKLGPKPVQALGLVLLLCFFVGLPMARRSRSPTMARSKKMLSR